jgi:drug/metabolite transporter (DMT)-like permease
MKLSKITIGYIELSLAQIFLSVNIIVGKILAPICPIFSLLTFRFFVGFSILSVCLYFAGFWQQIYSEIKRLEKHDWILLFLQSLFGGFLFNVLILYGLQRTNAIITSIINSTTPIFVALLSFLVLKETLSKTKIMAILLAVLGILLLGIKSVNLPDRGTELLGLLFVFLSTISAAVFIVLSKMSSVSINPLTNIMSINLLNAFLFLPLALNNEQGLSLDYPLLRWIQIMVYGISGSVLFFVLWYRGLRSVTANTAALFIGIMPISTSLFAFLFLKESVSRLEALGVLCVITSLYIGLARQSPQSHLALES